MTLSAVSPYDRSAVPTLGAHAVVVGGSMAGLLSARVLADAYDRVTLLERDSLPDDPVARRGVPQAAHVHVLLEAGRHVLRELFPGFQSELRSAGGVVMDAATELTYYEQGTPLADVRAEMPMCCASRPLFEFLVRRRVTDTDGVVIRPECHFTDYLTDADATAVEGVAFVNEAGDEETLAADLVVDATGRTSRTPRWLADHGYPSPPVDRVDVDLAYSTVAVERPPGDTRAFLVAPSPPRTHGGTAVPVEDGRWLVTLFGMHGSHPPTDREGLAAFTDELPAPEIAALLRDRRWRSEDVSHYPFAANRWRHYEELPAFPDGLVVTGDAIASFNPIYGQGMSVAALDALQLHHALAAGDESLPRRFFERSTDHLDIVWRIAVGADFDYPQTTGPKPTGTDLFNRYLSRLLDTAHDDAHVAEAFARVLRLEKPPTTLLRPSVAGRVLLSSLALGPSG